ncbi:MAG: hypothetical protein EP317_03745, partial [Bacillota bacterium]
MTKKDIRNEMIRMRNDMDKDVINQQRINIINKIKNDVDYQMSNMIAIFHPMGNEVDLLPLMKDKHKKFCFPKVEGEHIHFYA